ncbi:MAG: glycosyl hydrolase 108 family protein [Rhodospirillales bacterium]
MKVIFAEDQFWKPGPDDGFQSHSIDKLRETEISDWPGTVTVLVHGYSFDPRVTGPDNPFENQYPVWKRALGKRAYVDFGWYSVPRSFSSVRSAWRSGHWTTYGWAWRLAEQAGQALARILSAYDGEVNIVAHSLGSRVVNCALAHLPAGRIARVMFWNGADYVRNAERAAVQSPPTRFLNVYCPDDTVLERLGDVFAPASGRCIGNDGLSDRAPQNWIDIDLDAPVYADWAEQLETITRGDNPCEVGDHWESFRYPGNWPLCRAFLNDQPPFAVSPVIQSQSAFLSDDQVFNGFLVNLLKREGGFVHHRPADDPGGATIQGVSTRLLSSLRLDPRWSDLPVDVRDLTEGQITKIYRRVFFDPMQLSVISAACQTSGAGLLLPEFLFDVAVMSGIRNSGVLLQEAISESARVPLKVDGVIGPRTVTAFSEILRNGNYETCLRSMVTRRLKWLENLPNFKANPGWVLRTRSFIPASDETIKT